MKLLPNVNVNARSEVTTKPNKNTTTNNNHRDTIHNTSNLKINRFLNNIKITCICGDNYNLDREDAAALLAPRQRVYVPPPPSNDTEDPLLRVQTNIRKYIEMNK